MIALPNLRKQVSCISSAVIVMYIHVGRCMEKIKNITGMLGLMFYISLKCCL